jgi:hypothetical protein
LQYDNECEQGGDGNFCGEFNPHTYRDGNEHCDVHCHAYSHLDSDCDTNSDTDRHRDGTSPINLYTSTGGNEYSLGDDYAVTEWGRGSYRYTDADARVRVADHWR